MVQRPSKRRKISGTLALGVPALEAARRATHEIAVAFPAQSSRRAPHQTRESGQALLEFALCLPVLLLVLTGICTFGIYLTHYLILTNAVTVGAQQLAVSRGQTTDPCQLASSAVQSASPTLNATNLSYTFVLNSVTYQGTSCSSGSTGTGAAGNLVQGASATVTVSYPCSLAVYGINFPNCLLQSQTTELVQ